MSELKTGDLVLVSDFSVEDCKSSPLERVFLYVGASGQFFCQNADSFEQGSGMATDWEYAIKVPKTETRVKKASEIMKWLEDNGYKMVESYDWDKSGRITFNKSMWRHCGERPNEYWQWLPEWLEEVEVCEP